MPIDASELADLRGDMQGEMLTDTCQVQRKTLTDNGGGRGSQAYVNAGTYPARMWTKPTYRDMTETVQPGAGNVSAQVLWTVILPFDADILATDRLVIAGQTLEVSERDKGRTDALLMQVLCKRIG